MEACGVRLICTTCLSPGHTCEVFDWNSAVYHTGANILDIFAQPTLWFLASKCIGSLHHPTFQPLDAERTSQVKLLEEAAAIETKTIDVLKIMLYFGCTRCPLRLLVVGVAAVKAHCTISDRRILNPKLGADYYVHANSQRPRIRMYPQALRAHPSVIADVLVMQRAIIMSSSSLFVSDESSQPAPHSSS
ncbi:hypothetical protein C8Q80DRAFT_881376 [Daedaleopsis nitida]|nr:hypothetical protein C8Q80DRAFT_881376 [Daedaleopsis nitida]